MAIVPYILFFISGAAALIFETLWFRVAAFVLGASVPAAVIVLSSFMAGLALGAWSIARYGHRIQRPLRVYAAVQLATAFSGSAFILAGPSLSAWLAPLFHPVLDNPVLLSLIRFGLAFSFMVGPSVLMGMSLPLFVRGLQDTQPFGVRLGKLYGWNTLGSVVGALTGEPVLVQWVGVRGAGISAAILCSLAAAAAFWMAFRTGGERAVPASEEGSDRPGALPGAARPVLAAAFLSGGILIAFEVVWFRFLLLFFPPAVLVFDTLLAVILAGIGGGGLLAALLLRSRPGAPHLVPSLLFGYGVLSAVSYATIDRVLAPASGMQTLPGIILVSSYLMLPVSLLSGVVFTLLAARLHDLLHDGARTTGLLTCFNTTGALAGAGLASFFLIPVLGIERSFLMLSLLAGAAGLLSGSVPRLFRKDLSGYANSFAALALLFTCLFFPHGRMEKIFLVQPRDRFEQRGPDLKVAAVREGSQETIQYLRKEFQGEPLYYRLLTDSFSMSGTDLVNRRYMKLFVYWPLAVKPDIRNALLIAYGVGSTAKALTDTATLQSIDIVDTSKDIMDLSSVVYPDTRQNPVHDSRVHVHIEDARFYLQASGRHFDLITAEPPPPKNAGAVHLYTEEYFALLRDHLSEGGVISYWLPAQQLMQSETNAVLRAFCDVFDDCSLWAGSRLNLMLVGTRGLRTRVSPALFGSQWNDPAVKQEMVTLGIETPRQLAPLLVADTPELRDLLKNSAPLTDNFPERLSGGSLGPVQVAEYQHWLQALYGSAGPSHSPTIERLWPEGYRNVTAEDVRAQHLVNELLFGGGPEQRFESLHWVLTHTSLEMPVLFLMESDADVLKIIDKLIARGISDREFNYHLAARSLAQRRYDDAERYLVRYQKDVSGRTAGEVYLYRIYIQLLSGHRKKAEQLAKEFFDGAARGRWPDQAGYRQWVRSTFRLNMPLNSAF